MCLRVHVYACNHMHACVCVSVCWRVRVLPGSLAPGSARTLGPRARLGLMPRGVCKCKAGAFGVPRGPPPHGCLRVWPSYESLSGPDVSICHQRAY